MDGALVAVADSAAADWEEVDLEGDEAALVEEVLVEEVLAVRASGEGSAEAASVAVGLVVVNLGGGRLVVA